MSLVSYFGNLFGSISLDIFVKLSLYLSNCCCNVGYRNPIKISQLKNFSQWIITVFYFKSSNLHWPIICAFHKYTAKIKFYIYCWILRNCSFSSSIKHLMATLQFNNNTIENFLIMHNIKIICPIVIIYNAQIIDQLFCFVCLYLLLSLQI